MIYSGLSILFDIWRHLVDKLCIALNDYKTFGFIRHWM